MPEPNRAQRYANRFHDKKCAICGLSPWLTVSAKLYPLTVAGPKRTYTYQICDECVPLFNTSRWRRTVTMLRALNRPDMMSRLSEYLSGVKRFRARI